MGGYPPGMSKRDFIRAGIDQPHHHECEFEPGLEPPVLEDGAAIFHSECRYVEGEWGEGFSCEETRYERLEVERIVKVREGEPDVSYLASEERPRERFGVIERLYEDALVAVEMTDFRELDVEQVDPPSDYNDGYVRVRVGAEYKVIYKQ